MKEILDFNKKQENRDLQNYYSSKSFMEACGVGRDEKAHSAFLAWIIKETDDLFKANDTPLMWFLQAVISRVGNSTATLLPNFASLVLSRKLRYSNLEVYTEHFVKDVNNAYFRINWPSVGPSDDKMDIYIKCKLQNCLSIEDLEIVIENKVMSPEEGAKPIIKRMGYDDLSQTQRYFNVVSSTSGTNKIQLFVYLKPGHVDANTTASCDKFIQINYQDILDYILIPMLANEDISAKLKWRVQDYIEGLSLPTLDTNENKRIIMARTPEENDRLARFVEDNHDLLFEAMLAKVRKEKNAAPGPADDALLELVDSYKELFYAVADYTDKNLDLVSDTPVNGNYIVNGDLCVYNNMNFGFRFLELFYEENKTGLNKTTPYADQLNNLLKQFFGSPTSWYGDKTKDPKHYRVLDEDNNLSAMFGNFDQAKLDKLKNAISTNSPAWFKFIEIP